MKVTICVRCNRLVHADATHKLERLDTRSDVIVAAYTCFQCAAEYQQQLAMLADA